MDYGQLKEFFQQNAYYVLAAQLLIGCILGAIPLIFGIKRQKRNLGLIAFVICVILAPVVSPIVSLLIAVVLTIVILRAGRTRPDNFSQ